MTHDIRRDSTRYDSMRQIFEESGENIIWAWPIVNTTTARMKGAQDYRNCRRDRKYNTMTTDDGELTNSYPENNPDGDVANIDVRPYRLAVFTHLFKIWIKHASYMLPDSGQEGTHIKYLVSGLAEDDTF